MVSGSRDVICSARLEMAKMSPEPPSHSPDWLAHTLAALETVGYAVVPHVVSATMLAETRAATPHFFRYLELPEALAVIDATVAPTAILHLQNGFILPPTTAHERTDLFQKRFHRDFPRVLWIKQQIDYVRALGEAVVTAQAPRTQQLLGWYTRVVTGLDEYYRPEAERLYRKDQG